MALLTAPEERQLVSGNQPTAPLLRLRRQGDAERTVPLSSGKCTVGSSPQCQVCLPSPDVRPLQCLITLESNAASVTRWATGVQLNGREFNKAALEDGDRLTIGAWEIAFDLGGALRGVEPVVADDADAAPWGESESITAWASDEHEVAPSAPTFWPEEPTEVVPTPPSSVDALDQPEPTCDSPKSVAQQCEASLVQHLWTANFQARRRAKALINGIRAARFHADAMAADLAAMETELDLARAAYDSHLVNDDRLQQEATAQRRQHEERLTPLMEEISRLKADLERAKTALAEQVAECESLAVELAAVKESPSTPGEVDAAASRMSELEAAIIAQSRQLETLTVELRSAQEEQQRLARLYEAESQRAAALETALAETHAAAKAASVMVEPSTATEALQEPVADVWRDVQPLEAAAPVEAEPTSWAAFEPVADEPSAEAPAEVVDEIALAPVSSAWTAPTVLDDGPLATSAEQVPAAREQPASFTPPPTQAAEPVVEIESEAPPWAAAATVQPASEHASTSFIDKYRHLLEVDDASSLPLPKEAGRPVIDDEFLSPAKAETCASPADESDEALEAYMASMMRRVKSSSSSFANRPPERIAPETTPSFAGRLLQSAGEPAKADLLPTPDYSPEEPLSIEELKQATRKMPLASDLATLREIANSTARTAIATHSHRQDRESAITKIIVAITATVSAGYLMASAPAVDTWQFWAGAATCVVGITASVQVLLLERRQNSNR